MRDSYDRIRERGASVVGVICQKPEAVRSHFERDPVPFPIAIDAGRTVARAYGVYRLLGFDSIHIARPATFVIDRDGIIRRRHAGSLQWQMMPLDGILRALEEIG